MISADPLSAVEAQRYLQAARAVIAHPNVSDRNRHMQKLWQDFTQFEQLVMQTRFDIATPRQSRKMRKALQVQLPNLAKRCALLLAQNYANVARSRFRSKVPDGIFRRMHWQGFNQQLDTLVAVTAGPVLTVAPTRQQLTAGEELSVFPGLAAVNQSVDGALARLREAWERAVTLPTLTTEDRFLLQQIATGYLPDSWRLYSEAQNLHGDVREQAAGMLLTQLRSLQGEVDALLARGGEDVLTRLGAQTRFIQKKTQPAQPPELDLRSDVSDATSITPENS